MFHYSETGSFFSCSWGRGGRNVDRNHNLGCAGLPDPGLKRCSSPWVVKKGLGPSQGALVQAERGVRTPCSRADRINGSALIAAVIQPLTCPVWALTGFRQGRTNTWRLTLRPLFHSSDPINSGDNSALWDFLSLTEQSKGELQSWRSFLNYSTPIKTHSSRYSSAVCLLMRLPRSDISNLTTSQRNSFCLEAFCRVVLLIKGPWPDKIF